MKVFRAEVQQAVAFESITTRSTDLLAVALQASRNVVVDDVANVRLVDAHAKCYGSHDDEMIGGHELILAAELFDVSISQIISERYYDSAARFLPARVMTYLFSWLHASMEVPCFEAMRPKLRCELFRLLLQCDIDYCWAWMRFEETT